ncbi:hypothetical protein [Brevundimonas sp.]|jgi:hypothetical protein|uniref:hypothetical protein n=1 Tax=Brevundimonas sp. TaxID=1871086 RepID=UPI00378392D6
MSSVVISGDTSGAITVAAPLVAGTNTLTLQAATATSAVNTLSTAVASTSGTAIDFTNLPPWVKRITVMFQGTSHSATANILVQLGTGSTTYTTSGYIANSIACESAGNTATSSTAGFVVFTSAAAAIISGHMIITNISGNNWVSSHTTKRNTTTLVFGGGDVSLGAVLTAVRITTSSTDTFDAGSVNILYEG